MGCSSSSVSDVTIVVMSTDSIVALLIAERTKLDRAISALQGKENSPTPTVGVPAVEGTSPKKRHVSAAARRKMALGQKKRWEALKAATK
jgi:hypothetical protein